MNKPLGCFFSKNLYITPDLNEKKYIYDSILTNNFLPIVSGICSTIAKIATEKLIEEKKNSFLFDKEKIPPFFLLPSLTFSFMKEAFEEPFLQRKEISNLITRMKRREKFDRSFSAFKNRMHLLYIDKKRLEMPVRSNGKIVKPELIFDIAEPGYRDGMDKGFAFIRNTFGEKFNLDHLIQLHDQCIDDVYIDRERSDLFEKGLKRDPGHYGFHCDPSDELQKEWDAERLIALPGNIFEDKYFATCIFEDEINPHSRTNSKLHSNFDRHNKSHRKKVNDLFNQYYNSIEIACTKDEKLAAIVNLCRALEIFHIFIDGNQRAIAFCLLNKFLAENDFSPVILDDPYMFDGDYTTREMVQKIKEDLIT